MIASSAKGIPELKNKKWQNSKLTCGKSILDKAANENLK
jgi:hypothetical protein